MIFTLSTAEATDIEVTSETQILTALRDVRDGQTAFAILGTAKDVYIQTARDGDGFLLERRAGSEESHVSAQTAAGRAPSFADVEASFLAFHRRQGMPSALRWASEETKPAGCFPSIALLLCLAISANLPIGIPTTPIMSVL